MARVKTPAVSSRQPGSSGWASSIQAKTGTSTMRNAVKAFGTFHGLVSGSGAGVSGCLSDGEVGSGSTPAGYGSLLTPPSCPQPPGQPPRGRAQPHPEG